jgi:predicted MarR family transcription regulator
VFEAELKFTLTQATATTGPTLTRWMARAYAAPLRSQIFTVPILMHHKLNINGREYFQDVDREMTLLRDLVDTPRIVTYQENEVSFSVVVENVQFVTRQVAKIANPNDFEGTAIIVMRSVR